MRLSRSVWTLLALVLVAQGCNKSGEPDQTGKVVEQKASQPVGEVKIAVAQIGFLDQKDCCECTRNRIDKSWVALQAALGTGDKLPVDRILVDTQGEQAENFRRLRAYQVLPAIYFLDAKGNLVEMLQGEVNQDAFEKILQ
jgi:hypothetical protein